MARFTVPPDAGDLISVFDGEQNALYRVTNGEIEVPDDHARHIIAGLPGAVLIAPPEPPAKSVEPETPVKE